MRVWAALVVASLRYARASSPVAAGDSDEHPLLDRFDDLVPWFRQNGGTVDDRLGLGVEPSLGIRGTVALGRIPADTLLLHCPSTIMLAGEDQCKGVFEVESELRKGADSLFHVYLDMDDSLNSRIPSQWERGGRAVKELQGLPPSDETHRHVDWFEHACIEGAKIKDEVQMQALLMIITRSSDRGMIPIYDLLNHHNGLTNTYLTADEAGGLSIIALADIEEGEGIYNTYARGTGQSQSEMFNTYGFMEDWPQIWKWDDPHLVESHEIVILSPTVTALAPPVEMKNLFGAERHTPDNWAVGVDSFHKNLLKSKATEIGDSAERMLKSLPTSIDDDEVVLKNEKLWYEKVLASGTRDVNEEDVIKAMEYRLSFKRALHQAAKKAQTGVFQEDEDEL